MTHHITDEQIDELCLSLTGTYTRKERDRAVARAVLALAAPAPAVPSDVLSEMREFGNARMAEFMGAHHMALVLSQKINEWADKLTAAPTAPAQPVDLLERCAQWCDEQPKSNWWGRTASDMVRAFAATTTTATPAVPEDVAREPMTQRWCWWIGDAETFHIADTESEAHGEARCSIDDDCEPGDTREYSVGRVQHPIDALGVEWLAEHVAETIEENTREWCDDNTGAEDQSITLAAKDKKSLGTMVAAFLREKVSVHWWTADQKTITTHTYVAGSNAQADAARAAEKGGA